MSVSVEAPTSSRESVTARGRPLYLQSEPHPMFASLHPAERQASGTAVLLVPPFGWDELSAHRSFRAWAGALAAAGHTALRIDLPGTGDSGGSALEPGLVPIWCSAVETAAGWLRATQPCDRIVAIGVGLGGMLATRVLAGGDAIDDLVLWGVHSRGALLLREMRAFAAMIDAETADVDGFTPPPSPPDTLEIGGFVLSGETVAALEALDLAADELPDLAARRVLLLGRDGLRPDRALVAHLQDSHAQVTTADGAGYGAMMRPPQFAKRPNATIARTVSWVSAGESRRSAAPGGGRIAPVSATDTAEMLVDGDAVVVERPFDLEIAGGRLAGVLAEPRDGSRAAAPLTAVLLNAGAIRRIGPNRMWVEAARRWAARGIPTLRVDLLHLGDADGDERRYISNKEFYRPEVRAEIAAVLDGLDAAGLPDRFFVGGLCSGANQAFHAAFSDPRVRGVVLLNLWAFFWSEQLAASRDRRNARKMLRSRSWREIVRIAMGRGRIGRIAGMRAALASVWPDFGRLYTDRVGDALDGLHARGVATTFLFCHNEPLYDDYFANDWSKQLVRWPNVTLERIPIEDHMFRPLWAQRHVHERLDEAIGRAVEQAQANP